VQDSLIATLFLVPVAAILALTLTPLTRTFARRKGWIDRPDGLRKLHTAPVPRIGGVAVYASFAGALVLLVLSAPHMQFEGPLSSGGWRHLLLASAAVLAVGFVDDLRGVRPAAKLVVQAAAALYLYAHGFQIGAVSNPFSGEAFSLGALSLPTTLLWFVCMSNAFNLIDGLDGLAAGIGFFSTMTLFVAALVNERWEVALLSAALGGALLGFLRYNFNPASIFLGDSGALFVGFALAAVAIRGSMKSSAAIAVVAPLLALAVPILDVGIAMLRRFIGGRRLFVADGDHIHHRLLLKGFGPRQAVLLLYGVAAAFGALSLLTMRAQGRVVGLVVITLSVVTWIGIQQLGYSEFGEVQRILRHGLLHERQAIANNVHLQELARAFEQAENLEALWRALVECAERLRFERVELQLRAERSAPSGGVRRLVPVWHAPNAAHPVGATDTWRVPLACDGRSLGCLLLVRRLADAVAFEPSYLIDALQQTFTFRLAALADLRQAERAAAPATHESARPAT
jgi:UDP-GlcNAc:undecaprenyl-phosphate GlcNAc-1-phosphate transferase